MNKTVHLREYIKIAGGQKRAAERLHVTQGAISMSLTRNADVQVTYDTKTLDVVAAKKISDFGSCTT
mgnify:FL=1